MSKGSPIVPLRIPEELLAQIDVAVMESLAYRDAEPFTRTSFILEAVREVFRHRERAKAARKRRQAKRHAEGWTERAQRLATQRAAGNE
jgi:hypothetical protein